MSPNIFIKYIVKEKQAKKKTERVHVSRVGLIKKKRKEKEKKKNVLIPFHKYKVTIA